MMFYRIETGDYWETWLERPARRVVHWGKLGTPGETMTIREESEQAAEERTDEVIEGLLAEGFVPAEDVPHATLMIEYVLDNWGSVEDLDKRHRVQDLAMAALRRTGLGVCDGGSIGSGTMEVCNLVVDYELAKAVVEADLAGTEFADYARIYLEEDDEEDEEEDEYPEVDLEQRAAERSRRNARESERSDVERRHMLWTLYALCEAFNAHDLDRIMSFFAEECVLEMPRGPEPWGSRFEGKQAVREALAKRFQGLPDVHYGNAEHFLDYDGDTGMSKWTLTGTGPDGTRKEVNGCDFYTFRNGKVIRKDSYWKIVE